MTLPTKPWKGSLPKDAPQPIVSLIRLAAVLVDETERFDQLMRITPRTPEIDDAMTVTGRGVKALCDHLEPSFSDLVVAADMIGIGEYIEDVCDHAHVTLRLGSMNAGEPIKVMCGWSTDRYSGWQEAMTPRFEGLPDEPETVFAGEATGIWRDQKTGRIRVRVGDTKFSLHGRSLTVNGYDHGQLKQSGSKGLAFESTN